MPPTNQRDPETEGSIASAHAHGHPSADQLGRHLVKPEWIRTEAVVNAGLIIVGSTSFSHCWQRTLRMSPLASPWLRGRLPYHSWRHSRCLMWLKSATDTRHIRSTC